MCSSVVVGYNVRLSILIYVLNLQMCVFTMATSTTKASPGMTAVNMSVLVKMQILVFTAAHPSEYILGTSMMLIKVPFWPSLKTQ